MRYLLLGLLLVSGCNGTEASVCEATCAGCCDGDVCLAGNQQDACGRGGDVCLQCPAWAECASRGCRAVEKPDASEPDASVPECTVGNCPDGCCRDGQCLSGTSSQACGRASVCETCAGGDVCHRQACAAQMVITLRYDYRQPKSTCESEVLEHCSVPKSLRETDLPYLAERYPGCEVSGTATASTIDCTGLCESSTIECGPPAAPRRELRYQCPWLYLTGANSCSWNYEG